MQLPINGENIMPPSLSSFRTPQVSIYINWAAYDELSDNIELTEALAMHQLSELVRLRTLGVKFDYYLMDAFWYEADGGYREFRKSRWPQGAKPWLEECRKQNVLPGLWFSVNLPIQFNVIEKWKGSHNGKSGLWYSGLCLFDGPYLDDFMDILHFWYEKGVRCFKFDFADFGVATPEFEKKLTPEEIRERNIIAFHAGLARFKKEHPEALLLAYNGFGGQYANTSEPFKPSVDSRWLEIFDALYCGDPRPSDVPAGSLWRSKDFYSDHMVWQYLKNKIPFDRIDNSGFMVGSTGTCYYRAKAAWKGMLLLSLARCGHYNTYYGDLSLFSEEEGKWFAKIQSLFYGFFPEGKWARFGGVPGKKEPYGYALWNEKGGLVTLVNPAQLKCTLELPESPFGTVDEKGAILFADGGFPCFLEKKVLILGGEQVVLTGFGEYSLEKYALGRGDDPVLPQKVEPFPAKFRNGEKNSIETTLVLESSCTLRIIFRQTLNGAVFRSTGGAYPQRLSLDKILTFRAQQNGKEIPVHITHDKRIWSGLSWAVGEIKAGDIKAGIPLSLVCRSAEEKELVLTGEVYCITESARRNTGAAGQS